jgi:hypothetical protein
MVRALPARRSDPERKTVATGTSGNDPSGDPDVPEKEGAMSKVMADISMSLVGFVTEPTPGAENPLGDDPGRLHDLDVRQEDPTDAEIVDEIYATSGAVLIGKRMFDVGVEPWGDPPPFGMPVFVVTHESREPWLRQGARRTTS